MNNFLYTLVLVVFFSFSGFQQAQNLSDNYKPLTCKGALSTDLSTDYMVLANKEIDIAQSKGMLITADVRDFFVGNNADLNNLFFSGKVLFGDEVTKYVQSVGNRILEKNDIKRDIRFYVLKSSEVNAFANQNNIIFITIGLLTQLENESQLAFVLGHEITHIVKDHSIVGYQHTQDKSRDFANGLSTYDDLVQNLSDYSQENELESDKMGLELINKAGYTSSSSVGVIKVLKYGLLPYDEQVFDRSFFNTSNFTLEESNFAKNIEVVPDKESDFETHPEENERINKLEKMIKADNGEEYMISKDQFLYIRDLARFENLKVNLLKKEFIRSLYESYLLQQTYPNNEFVKDVQAKSIYGIAKVMNSIDEDILEESITKELSVSEYYNLYSLHYYNLEDKEQLALAISYLAHQNDSDYNKYIEDLIVDLKTEHEVVYSDFKWAIDKDKKKEMFYF